MHTLGRADRGCLPCRFSAFWLGLSSSVVSGALKHLHWEGGCNPMTSLHLEGWFQQGLRCAARQNTGGRPMVESEPSGRVLLVRLGAALGLGLFAEF